MGQDESRSHERPDFDMHPLMAGNLATANDITIKLGMEMVLSTSGWA